MGYIDRRPSGRWRARYRDPEGRERSQTFDRKGDAERFLQRNGADLQRGEWIDPALRRVLFSEWADQWWQTTARLRPSTRRGYWQILQNHVLPEFGDRPLASLDSMDVERFVATKLADGVLGPKKTRDCVSVISLVMQAAIRSGARRDNPAAGHHVPVHRRRIRQGDVLTMTEVHALTDHVRDPYKPAVWLLIFTGMRPAELCGLRVRSVDFVRHLVIIRETLLPVSAYADQRLALVSGPPKTEAGDRTIPIPGWLCDQLAAMLAARAAQRGAPVELAEPLFVNRVGKPLNRDKFRETVIRPALIAAGLPPSTRTYDLRHAHASMLIDLGANVLAVAQRMGHSDATVTLREYGHLFAGVQERLSEQLEDLRARSASATPGEVVPIAVRDAPGRTQDAPGRKNPVRRGSQRSGAASQKPSLTRENVD
jgi:integrase